MSRVELQEAQANARTIGGHPALPLLNDKGDTMKMITCCSECGELRTIIFLDDDRWYCSGCRSSGTSKPAMYPIS